MHLTGELLTASQAEGNCLFIASVPPACIQHRLQHGKLYVRMYLNTVYGGFNEVVTLSSALPRD